jgi:type I restriction-modification system DNA methylase subunit
MPIFQKSIVDKYVATIDVDVIDKAFESYKHIYSAQKIQRIKKLKEEQYQGGFLKDIFGSVLGYTIDPEVGYNLELEKKNETNSKKADGAILKDEKVLGVIELKSNTTKNLESIKDQAFGYKNNHKGCKYVISSNFHKLRFYVDDATEYEEFDLYNLDKETFKRFYLFLRKEGLLDKNIPKLLKEETKFHEENISKQLYKDYSAFKNKFFENIVKNNPQYDKLLLFKKSQKFLDRILFVLFAEDKELIPTNAISKIVESWVYADDLHYKPLYELFTILFEHLNVGHTYKSGYEIPAYNGGLFAPDDVLDNLKVDDEILKDDLLILSKYDFNTDVDVNILGHIFEHSLSEIEEIEAQLKGEKVDKSKGKRKKDGVFYTPKYITKYIVDNTVGKLCSEKKDALGLGIDFDIQNYQKSDGSVNQKGKTLFYTLESYKEWLLTLKILDPACGSGAFLNQALSFLIEEHKNIDDLIAELTNTPLRIFDTDKAILENNIFGVDINDESVEIAKLSLWLRTAQKGRKLSNLNNNIKCGNSLIDDPQIVGDKAFKWEEEFPQIFNDGGFDVVIGNPPYVLCQPSNTNEIILNYYKLYEVASYKIDLFHLFFEKSINILSSNGKLGFITPNTYLNNKHIKPLRSFILYHTSINTVLNYKDEVFVDAGVDVATIVLTKEKKPSNNIMLIEVENSIENELGSKPQVLWKKDKDNIFNLNKEFKIKFEDCIPLNEICSSYFGIQAYDRKSSITTKKINNDHLPIIDGGDINKFSYSTPNKYFNFLAERIKSGGNYKVYNEKRIVISQIGYTPIVGICEKGILASNTLYNINLKQNSSYHLNFLLCILNSSLLKTYWISKYSDGKKLFPKIKGFQLKELPIKIAQERIQIPFVEIANHMLSLNHDLQKINDSFISLLQSKFRIEKISKKIEKWHGLDFGTFLEELKNKKAQLGLSEEAEWMQYFNEQKEKAQNLIFEIYKTDAQIDAMVYELYGLTEAEIEIVENS